MGTADVSAPLAVLLTEKELLAAIENFAPKRYRRKREQLYAALGKLDPDTRRCVLLVLGGEYQMHRRAPGRQRRASRRTVSEPRIKAADYAKQHKDLERLLRRIDEHPLVYSFCHAHLQRYPKEAAICPHERWTKGCPECQGFDSPRGRGKPRDTRRRRLLNAVIPMLEADKGTFEACIPYLRSILRCFGDSIEEPASLRRYWDRLRRKADEDKRDLAAFWQSVVPLSQVREWTPQPDEVLCRCPPRDATKFAPVARLILS